MKTCSYCGGKYSDETVVCPVDQTPLGGTPASSSPVVRSVDSPRISFEHSSLSPEQMQQAWVTLTKCGTMVGADLAAMKLRGAGIEVFIPDEYLMQANAVNVNTYGFVRVQVAPKDYESAKAILSAPDVEESSAG